MALLGFMAWPFLVGLLAMATQKRLAHARTAVAWAVALSPPLLLLAVGMGFLQLGPIAYSGPVTVLVSGFVLGAFSGTLVRLARSRPRAGTSHSK